MVLILVTAQTHTETISTVTLEIIIGIVTFVLSVGSSMFIAGTQWGSVKTELRYMNDRLAKIEGMYTLSPRKEDHS